MIVGYPARRMDNKEQKMMTQTGAYVSDEDHLVIIFILRLQYTDLDLVVVEDRMWLHTVNHA
jgi:hypothetical protein